MSDSITYTAPLSVRSLSLQVGAREDCRHLVFHLDPAEAVRGACVQYARLTDYEYDGDFTESNSVTVAGTVTDSPEIPLDSELARGFYACRVRLEGLSAGERYVYRVGDTERFEEGLHHLRMPSAPHKRQEFAFVSDVHISVYSRKSGDGRFSIDRFNGLLGAIRDFSSDEPAFVCSTGDNMSVCNMGERFYADPSKKTREWNAAFCRAELSEFFSAPLMSSVTFTSTLGNHEAQNLQEADPLASATSLFYDLPNDDGYAGHYLDGTSGDFFFTSGRVLVVGINAVGHPTGNRTPCASEVHRAFIRRAVESSPNAIFRLLVTHVPAYAYVGGGDKRADGGDSESFVMRTFFCDMIDEFGFDLVFTGHSHAFSRTYPILANAVVDREALKEERDEEGYRHDTLASHRGTVHYNVPAAMNHSFYENVPENYREVYANYGVTERALDAARERGMKEALEFGGVAFSSPMFVHVTVEEDILTVRTVRSDTNTAVDTLVMRSKRA